MNRLIFFVVKKINLRTIAKFNLVQVRAYKKGLTCLALKKVDTVGSKEQCNERTPQDKMGLE